MQCTFSELLTGKRCPPHLLLPALANGLRCTWYGRAPGMAYRYTRHHGSFRYEQHAVRRLSLQCPPQSDAIACSFRAFRLKLHPTFALSVQRVCTGTYGPWLHWDMEPSARTACATAIAMP